MHRCGLHILQGKIDLLICRKLVPMKTPKVILCYVVAALVLSGCSEKSKWELSWSDEFEYTGAPDEASWDYEIGFIRNKELGD